MSHPLRIQRHRTLGWRLPENARCVTRPGRWGNPYEVHIFGRLLVRKLFFNSLAGIWDPNIVAEESRGIQKKAYDRHKAFIRRFGKIHPMDAARTELRGKKLACFCPMDAEWCHADDLCEVANR